MYLIYYNDALEGEVQTHHEASCGWVRTEVITRSERSACIVNIVTLVTGEGIEVLGRYVNTYT